MEINARDWNLKQTAPHVWRGQAEAVRLPELARAVKEEGGQLVALWGSDDRHLGAGYGLHAAFITAHGLAWVSAPLAAEAPAYPDLAVVFPQAERMQRATRDLLGIAASGAVDDRKFELPAGWLGMDLRAVPPDRIAQALEGIKPMLERGR